MLPAFRQSLLAVFAVLLVLVGLGHQVTGRFTAHGHEIAVAECCAAAESASSTGHEDHSSSPDSHKACDHALCCHGTLAWVESPVLLPERAWIELAHEVEKGSRPPEAEPLGIDHPPQLS